MTRLITDWIKDMEMTAKAWDIKLRDMTGLGYIELASIAAESTVEDILYDMEEYKVAVVPVTSGQGVIGNFAEAVAAIVRSMGYEVFVTERTDVDGLYEASVRDADFALLADDNRYIAINLYNGGVADNNIATAMGYTELLKNMAGDLEDEPVAVLGYGIIGQLMALNLAEAGDRVAVFDKDSEKRAQAEADGYLWIDEEELKEYKYIADATNEGGWLTADKINTEEVVIVAPGIPLSLDEDAKAAVEGRYIHDMLEIGTATMLGMVIFG